MLPRVHRRCRPFLLSYGSAIDQDKDQKQLTVKDLYPGHDDEWYAEAEANLRRHAAILLKIYDRRKAEGLPWSDADEKPKAKKYRIILSVPSTSFKDEAVLGMTIRSTLWPDPPA